MNGGNSIISILDIQSKGTQDADANENAFCVLCVLVYYTIRVFVYLYVHTYAHMHRAFVPALWQGRAAHKTCVICAIAMCLHIHVLHVFVIHSKFEYPPPPHINKSIEHATNCKHNNTAFNNAVEERTKSQRLSRIKSKDAAQH